MEPNRDPRNGEPEDGNEQGGIGKWVAVVFVLALAAFSIYIVNTIIKQVNLQNCIYSGRRDCIEIVPGSDSTGH